MTAPSTREREVERLRETISERASLLYGGDDSLSEQLHELFDAADALCALASRPWVRKADVVSPGKAPICEWDFGPTMELRFDDRKVWAMLIDVAGVEVVE